MFRIFLAALMLASPAFADETWTNDYGQVIYEDDLDATAVFSAESPEGLIWMYVDNLGGNFDQRFGIFTGVWIIEEDGYCSSSLLTADGRGSNYWGTLELVWDGTPFPTGWSARFGDCGQPPLRTMRATPPN